jgi:hypothetical protein
MVRRVGSWGIASFENDSASDWFYTVSVTAPAARASIRC